METQREIQKNMTVYNFDTIDVDGKPETLFKCLKQLVGLGDDSRTLSSDGRLLLAYSSAVHSLNLGSLLK